MIVHVADHADAERVERELVAQGLSVERLHGNGGRVVFCILSRSRRVSPESLLRIEGVEDVSTRPSPHPLLDRQSLPVVVSGVPIGGQHSTWMVGPCAVESAEQIEAIAARLRPLGVQFLRGGAYKPRTSPYAFQGVGDSGLSWLRRAADRHGLRVVTECLSTDTVGEVAQLSDLVQIGSRNMHNYDLLKAVAKAAKPVLLKRGMAATIEEWMLAGEYLLHHGASAVLFCERGIRGFDASTRGLLDLGGVALLANVYHQPVIVDPSHAVGRRDLIAPLSRAALAAGAAGLMIETHDDPGRALSDGSQALPPDELTALFTSLDHPRTADLTQTTA